MTGDAPHRVASFFLAHALRQRLHLAERAHSAAVVTRINKVSYKIREVFAGLEFIEMASWLLDRDVSFQVALHANFIAARRRELRGIDDRAVVRGVIFPRAMAAFAGDSGVRENGRR